MRISVLGMAAALVLGLAACAHAGVMGQSVSVVLTNGHVVNGTLLGVSDGVLTVELANGSTRDLSESRVRKLFDADGNAVDLADLGVAAAAATPAVVATPAAYPRHKGKLIASNILLIGGAVVTGVAVIMGGAGSHEESDATSVYYKEIGATTSGDYAYETIPGEPGYYTYTQYVDYYEGASEVDFGLAFGLVGLGCVITGWIIHPSDPPQNAALLNYKDGTLALGLPQVNFNPKTMGYQTTLATARF